MDISVTTKATRLLGLNVDGETVVAYYGRKQLELAGVTEPELAAVRIGNRVFTPCLDSDLRMALELEWLTGKPAADVAPAQEATLREDSQIVCVQ